MVDDFENVTCVDGFPTIEAKRKGMFGFLVLDIVLKAFLARAVPASRHNGFNHRFFSADGTFIANFRLNLLKDVSTKLVSDVLLAGLGVGGKALDKFLKVHIIGKTVGYIGGGSCFLFLYGNGFVTGQDGMATGLAETKDLGEDCSI